MNLARGTTNALQHKWVVATLRWEPDTGGGGGSGGGLTDTELRATPITVSGPLTDTELRATAVPVSGPLTDAQIRATALPVSGPATDAQLRASALPVSISRTALTANSPASGSVGVVSASLVAANASRKGLVLINLSDNRVSLGFGATAVLSAGITLEPGATWTMQDLTFVTSVVNAIAAGAASTVSVQEYQ